MPHPAKHFVRQFGKQKWLFNVFLRTGFSRDCGYHRSLSAERVVRVGTQKLPASCTDLLLYCDLLSPNLRSKVDLELIFIEKIKNYCWIVPTGHSNLRRLQRSSCVGLRRAEAWAERQRAVPEDEQQLQLFVASRNPRRDLAPVCPCRKSSASVNSWNP